MVYNYLYLSTYLMDLTSLDGRVTSFHLPFCRPHPGKGGNAASHGHLKESRIGKILEDRMIRYLSALLFLLLPVLAFSADENVFVAQPGPDGVQRAELKAGSYFFRPGHIVVEAGSPVELIIRNESGRVPHNFVMSSPEAGMEIDRALSEAVTVVRFTPSRPGKYAFYCDKKLLFFKSHRDKGMEGVLEVR